MKILGVIPARYASTRFPGKPLALIAGKSMIHHVYDQVKKVPDLMDVVVATDDTRIFDEVTRFGGQAIMTNQNHNSGTERCLEALEHYHRKVDALINIQGDEPLINPQQIEQIATLLKDGVSIASLAKRIRDLNELTNPNVVKVVCSVNGKALYFSRQPIPFVRTKHPDEWLMHHDYYKHVGIYGYQTESLRTICKLPASSLEVAESLEQLRWLQHGMEIVLGITQIETIGVDTPDDLKKIANLF